MIIAEYIWLGGDNELRSKAKVIYNTKFRLSLNNIEELPEWNYDGSSTNQASGQASEIILKPVKACGCPFRQNDNILVMCDTYTPSGEPIFNNHRKTAKEIFDLALEEKPWFGIEQEFFFMNRFTGKPLGFPPQGSPQPQGQYYCSVGADNAFGREILEDHLDACIFAGLQISGINAEVAPGQWEYQIGPCEGIDSGDQLWLSRYILQRIAEKHGVGVCLHPKPLQGDWNGSGCHTNYSTRSTREGNNDKTGLEVIYEHMDKLDRKHREHMEVYGEGNNLRMTGLHETADFNNFSYGVGNRGASVRIPNTTLHNNCGYYEDRRPSSNMDPYIVTSKLFETTVM